MPGNYSADLGQFLHSIEADLGEKMSLYKLSQGLPDLMKRFVAIMAAAIDRNTAADNSAPVKTDAPSLRAVMRSSRVRAWVPAHLIDSLHIPS